MHHYIKKYRAIHLAQHAAIFATVKKQIEPSLSLLGLAFSLPQISRITQKHNEVSALNYYLANLNPTVNALATVFGMPDLAAFTAAAHTIHQKQQSTNTVEGALITLGDHSGEIRAMVGGYSWQESQFNRAVNARLQEGSSIKPLYYSVAISSGKFTVATPIYDAPTVFWNPDGTPYMPRDFLGQWQGMVSLRWALDDSINVASLKILQAVGFKAAINRISRMMGLSQYRNNPHYFPHVYPLGLGIVPVAPINMARAYAPFANQGRLVTPVAIRYVQDRATGKLILQPELQLRQQQQREGKKLQIMSPQAAYVMVNLLESVVTGGDLWQTYFDVGGWNGMPMAGKTGTTENWDDAWVVGFSPYYTSAVWFGFDHKGASLGLGLTGATGTGPAWAHYMKAIDAGKKPIPFPEPPGIVHVVVDCTSGLLPTQYSTCTKNEPFIAGTQPTTYDTLARYRDLRTSAVVSKLQNSPLVQSLSGTSPGSSISLPMPLGSSSSLYNSLPPVATPVFAPAAKSGGARTGKGSAPQSSNSHLLQAVSQQAAGSGASPSQSQGYNPLLN
jgi:penicillin-binding protein 1A